jgi:hypothetical protein
MCRTSRSHAIAAAVSELPLLISHPLPSMSCRLDIKTSGIAACPCRVASSSLMSTSPPTPNPELLRLAVAHAALAGLTPSSLPFLTISLSRMPPTSQHHPTSHPAPSRSLALPHPRDRRAQHRRAHLPAQPRRHQHAGHHQGRGCQLASHGEVGPRVPQPGHGCSGG